MYIWIFTPRAAKYPERFLPPEGSLSFVIMEKLNILIANNWRFTTGGLEVWGSKLAKGLLERGHQVAFAVRRDSKLRQQLKGDGLEVYAYPMRGDMDPRTVFPMMRLIREKPFHVILTMRERDFRLASLAAKLARRGRVVARLRAVCGHNRNQWRRDFQFYRQRWRYNYFATKVVTNSHMGKRDLVEGGWLSEDKVEVIHNGVDLRVFDPEKVPRGVVRQEYGIPTAATVVVLIAGITARKGQLILVEAAEEILKRQRDTFFLIVGPINYLAYYEELVKRVDQSMYRERIILTGLRSDIPRILADGDVLVLPSGAEGLSNVVLEAMAMGRPVIATDVGGMLEAVEHGGNGFLLPVPVKLPDFCKKLEFLLTHPKERERMGFAGRKKVQQEFDLVQSVERYESLFYRILAA